MSSFCQILLPEFDEEMKNTRKILERVPDAQWSWKPHEKSGTLGWLAAHVATLPEWLTMTMNTVDFDYAPVGGSAYEAPKIENRAQLLSVFDKKVSEARAALVAGSDADFQHDWTLLAGGQKIFTMSRAACIRSMILNHLIHHRAQLTVYFRLLDVAVPGLYGPSADETQSGAAAASN